MKRVMCPGSGDTVRLQGLQIVALRAIVPLANRTAVIPNHKALAKPVAKVIIIEPFDRGEFKASVEGFPKIWGNGKDHDESIGSMVKNHHEDFGISAIKVQP